MINQSGIYQILNTVNGKRYIGSAVCFKDRWANHLNLLKLGTHQTYLQNSWNKHGCKNFKFEILIVCDKVNLLFYEQLLLDVLWNTGLYNICPKAGSRLGAKLSPESRLRVAESSRGRRHSEQAKLKVSLANKGKILSEEYRLKISKSLTGRTYSKETLKLMSESHKGTKLSTEHRNKISKGLLKAYESGNRVGFLKGKPPVNKGKPMSLEQREKLKIAWVRRKARKLNA